MNTTTANVLVKIKAAIVIGVVVSEHSATLVLTNTTFTYVMPHNELMKVDR